MKPTPPLGPSVTNKPCMRRQATHSRSVSKHTGPGPEGAVAASCQGSDSAWGQGDERAKEQGCVFMCAWERPLTTRTGSGLGSYEEKCYIEDLRCRS
eukprot:359328-Chlamydomonas_euryale.AAC.8